MKTIYNCSTIFFSYLTVCLGDISISAHIIFNGYMVLALYHQGSKSGSETCTILHLER